MKNKSEEYQKKYQLMKEQQKEIVPEIGTGSRIGRFIPKEPGEAPEIKYKLSDITKDVKGKTLRRIQAVKNFNNIRSGDYGGYIENQENLSHKDSCWIYGDACVFDKARVRKEAIVGDNAMIYDSAIISENAYIFGSALVFGKSRIRGNAVVYDKATIHGHAKVYDQAKIYGRAIVYNNARIYGRAIVRDEANVYGKAKVSGRAEVYGSAKIHNNARVTGVAKVDFEVKKDIMISEEKTNIKQTLLQKLNEQERYPEDLDAVVMGDQLILAAEEGNIKQVKMLIDQGADVNARDEDGWTPLYLATHWGHTDVVKLLKQHGAKE